MIRHLLCLLMLLGFAGAALSAPRAEPWPRWETHDAQSTARIDHRAWTELLRGYLYRGEDGINRFHYAALGEDDFGKLEDYLADMAQIEISAFNRARQQAYWINLYNALTIREILRFYPVESIRKISSGLFSFGPWDKELIEVEGVPLTLNDIEHRILRPIWRDPRIHYAVNCASLGCPDLQPQAFTADNTETLLQQAARAFVNHPRGARVTDGELEVSSIYTWFIDDFGGDDAGVIRHLRHYADPGLRDALQGIDSISDDDYDWKLNSVNDPDQLMRLDGSGT